MKQLRRRQKFGKYIIEGRLGEGGFATVYRARDTIEGVRVALKIPHDELFNKETLALFQREVRLAAQLDHPHVLSLKYADFIEGKFVVVTAVGLETLETRLQRRLGTSKALQFAEQMIAAVACAHAKKIIHCDIKPENFILFPDDQIRLADFGIAIVAQKTVQGSGSGTVGYMAPEQALGLPSMRSDVFSLGLVLYRMLAGVLPAWPFQWPLAGQRRLTSRVHPEIVALIRRAIQVDSKKRFASAEQMLTAFRRVPTGKRARRPSAAAGNNGTTRRRTAAAITAGSWRSVRFREFQRRFKRTLETTAKCRGCHGPVAESMTTCPWCGKSQKKYAGDTNYPEQCPRCLRGMKKDWQYCPWCHGGGFDVATNRTYADRRYARQKCQNPRCQRKTLFPFMRYCPWCNTKVKRPWKLADTNGPAPDQCRCRSCGWGVLPEFWSHCPWCALPIKGAKN